GNFTGEADFMEQRECLAGSPRIYGQLVGLLGKYSKFAPAGDKAAVRQALANGADGAADDQSVDMGADADVTAHPDSAAEDQQTRPSAAP
ncbi:MAG TPA: inositol monophosphatase, partial [Alicycliphilus sp.]|nr:inositol monophosphatase [Alicycliphilus sp.]